ncbi:MAG: endonuclease III [Candidatus Aenigmarchaeota archaeon]|nr:endonuclease III [Candidatus Aenigmarchaeota archaeon]
MENNKRILKQLKELERLSSNMRLAAEKWSNPWQTLISTILSARTRDEITIPIANKLFEKYPTVKSLAKGKVKNIQKIIRPINFYKTKSKNIIKCAKILAKKYNGNPPHDFERLLELPGVGRKTANVFLSEMGKDTIGIDTHVSYLSQKLSWTKNKNPEKIEEDLKRLFPKYYWKKINPILVRFGKTYTSRRKKDEILKRLKR